MVIGPEFRAYDAWLCGRTFTDQATAVQAYRCKLHLDCLTSNPESAGLIASAVKDFAKLEMMLGAN